MQCKESKTLYGSRFHYFYPESSLYHFNPLYAAVSLPSDFPLCTYLVCFSLFLSERLHSYWTFLFWLTSPTTTLNYSLKGLKVIIPSSCSADLNYCIDSELLCLCDLDVSPRWICMSSLSLVIVFPLVCLLHLVNADHDNSGILLWIRALICLLTFYLRI